MRLLLPLYRQRAQRRAWLRAIQLKLRDGGRKLSEILFTPLPPLMSPLGLTLFAGPATVAAIAFAAVWSDDVTVSV